MGVPISWVDAFAERPYSGNPAAVCRLARPAGEHWMQGLAFELGIAECAFVVQSGDVFDLRWFTPLTEVDLCGHATLATAHALREDGVVSGERPVRFATRSGELVAAFDGDMIELDLPADPPAPIARPPELAWLDADIRQCARGAFFLLVEVASEDQVRALAPDPAAVRSLPDRAVIITAPAEGAGTDMVLRMFAPKMGIDEDPVTGSAQCVAAPYWAERLGRIELVAEQASARTGRLRVRLVDDRVRVAGRAVTVLRGEVDVT